MTEPPSGADGERSDRWRELSLGGGRGQGCASHQDSGYRAGPDCGRGGWGRAGRLGGTRATKVGEDGLDGEGVLDGGDNTQPAATAGTNENIEGEHAVHQRRPGPGARESTSTTIAGSASAWVERPRPSDSLSPGSRRPPAFCDPLDSHSLGGSRLLFGTSADNPRGSGVLTPYSNA